MERVGDVFLAREPVTYASHSGFTPIARSLDLLRAGLTVQEGGLVGTVELLPGRWCFKDTVALRYLRKQNLWLLGWRMNASSWLIRHLDFIFLLPLKLLAIHSCYVHL